MTQAVLQLDKLAAIEEELIAMNPLRICAALPELELLSQFSVAAPGSLDRIQRIRQLAQQAASIYAGWISLAASLAGGYDATGNPATHTNGVLRTEA